MMGNKELESLDDKTLLSLSLKMYNFISH